jgi:diguanylate cyclase (GGDEF)-like protein/PAS domain S-box-containing protein
MDKRTEAPETDMCAQATLPRLIQRWLKHLALHAQSCPELLERLPCEALDVDDLALLLEQLTERIDAHAESLRIESAIFDNVKEGIVVTDAAGRIIRINRAYSQVTGYSAAEIMGKRPGDFLNSGVHGADFYQRMWSDITNKGIWQGEIWNRRKDGETFLEQLTITSVKDEAGEIINLVGVFGDITDLRLIEHKLKQLNHYDSLTNLPNRTLLVEQLTRQVMQAGRAERIFGVVCFDLDHFKSINDRYGEPVGDRLLLEVANRLHGAIREGDTVARLGGDEFAVIMADLKEAKGMEIALCRLRDQLGMPYLIGGHEITITASMGATVYPEDNDDADTLLRHANQAMVEAKQSGRNCFRMFDPRREENARQRSEQMECLGQALRRGELRLFYQPKVDLRSGKTVGAEALIRWRHPERGLLSPASFLPYAEDNHLMVELGDWVIEKALDQASEWNALGLDITVSVNVAAMQLQQPDFVEKLEQALLRHPGIRHGQLEMEILESSALRDVDHTRQVLNACRLLGVGAALDDFGTGYCSLSYLKQIPATTLKIDQYFVRSMLGKREDLGLVEGIISLAKIFQMNVVAEGMETPEHGVLLLRLGCDMAQGYGIAKPMPAEELPGWIRDYVPHPSWNTWADLDWDLSDFPLIVAQYDHIDWVRQILLSLEGEITALDPAELHDHHECRLGKWYYGRGRDCYGHLAEFRDMEDLHREIHHLGPRILELLAAGNREAAHAECMTLLDLKSRILSLMQSLQVAVARHHDKAHHRQDPNPV